MYVSESIYKCIYMYMYIHLYIIYYYTTCVHWQTLLKALSCTTLTVFQNSPMTHNLYRNKINF